MAISYWPKHGESNTEASFAAYVDKLLGYADHASSDTAFMFQYTSTSGGNDTYTLAAGSYMFDGFLFTADGTETVSVTTATATDVYLNYEVDGSSHISSASVSATAGTYNLKLWTLSAGNVAGAITDYRKVFTWGRQSYANTDAGCVDFLSSIETPLTAGEATYNATYVLKSFRTAYPGSVTVTFDLWADVAAASLTRIYKVRGGVGTSESTTFTIDTDATYKSQTYTMSGLQAGDYIALQGNIASYTYKAKNFRIRYKLTDTATAAVVVD